MVLPLSSWNVNYHCGNYTVLWPTWRSYNVRLDESKLFYIDEGEIIIRTKGEEILCRAGDMVLIPSGTLHDFYLSEKLSAKKYWFHFSLSCENVSVLDRYKLPIKITVSSEEIKSLFAEATAQINNECDALIQISAITKLVSYYIKACGQRIENDRSDEIDKTLQFIGDNISRDFSLASLSDMVHLSPNYFARKFRERMGISPMKYISLARLERAKSLLSGTNLRIGEIMERVGISDAAYFSRSFKAITGYSPRTYRDMVRIKEI